MGKNEYWGASTSTDTITEAVNAASSSNTTPPPPPLNSRLLLNHSSRQVVSIWTCSKLCAFCFVAGIVVGFTLKRRVRRWASTLLRRLKDD